MKYLRYQLIFFGIFVLIYGIVSYSLYQNEIANTREIETLEFKQILEQRQDFLMDLLPDDQEIFPNYNKKLLITKNVYYPYLTKIKAIMASFKKGWKKGIKKTPFPFPEHAAIYVSHRGKPKVHIGNSFEGILPYKWQNKTFLGIRKGQGVFSRIQNLYTLLKIKLALIPL